LPRATGAAITEAAFTVDKPSNRTDRPTVLVVDDDEDVRAIMVAYLEELGYPAIPASSGRMALDLLNDVDLAQPIDLLVVDYAMPGLSGIEVARAARTVSPDLPNIIVSGYADASFCDDWLSGTQLLRKPYRLRDLAIAIETVLNRRGTSMTNVLSITARHP
jgi:CheY-like chemotaxis protein